MLSWTAPTVAARALVRLAVTSLTAIVLLSCSSTPADPSVGASRAGLSSTDMGVDDSGTPATPVTLIHDCAELQAINADLSGHYRLANAIDCTGFDFGDGGGFMPLGRAGGFRGVLEGDGHTITGLSIQRPGMNRVGLFGDLRGGTITEVGLNDASIRGRDRVGGLVGRLVSDGVVRETYVLGSVRGRREAGGLVGVIHRGTVENSYSCATFQCHGGQCGLLVGRLLRGSVTDSFAAAPGHWQRRLIGARGPHTTVDASFYDCTLTGWCPWWSDTALPTTQLQDEAYLTGQGWDFADVWGFAGPGNYPCLQWEAGCGTSSCDPDDATCDGVDDDCDGSNDEDYAPVSTDCGVGACASTGDTSCVAGSVENSCTPGTPAADDATCDDVDDDCDGTSDEDYASSSTTCGVGECVASGSLSCAGGVETDSCTPGTPAANDATCDALDDDCDAAADEDYADTPTTCGVGACGATGTTTCAAGVEGDTCTPGSPAPSDATCDDVDDDCDGASDEDYASSPTTCGVGACEATGATSCVGGSVTDSCAPGSPTGVDDTCDGVDDDCDGSVDEGYASVSTSCGQGVCAATGATSCVGGSVVDSCTAGSPTGADDVCDGADEDCDGNVDEAYASASTSCGQGVCAATGATSCVGGSVVDSCTAGSPTGADDVCDGADEDCDGATDEAYASTPTACGTGVCAASGATACVGGSVQDSCTAGSPTGADDVCDGLDEDCDGATDEAYASTPTTCGDGVCAASGATSCVGGSVQDSCAAGSPTGSDDVCDGLDEDCDGAIDEAYASTPTACGEGVCAASGATSCVGGSVQDSCSVGSPTGSDDACDGLDEDCDGSIDEAYASTPTACGEGVCAASGATSCVSGSVVDSCTAGSPTGADETCDGVDDDCDGVIDEGYASVPTSCGEGVCVATGATSCVGGSVVDSCTAGSPTGSDDVCDGVDQDCDGAVDEAYASVPTSCGDGVCAATGTTSCVAGSVEDSCSAGAPTGSDDTCDGLDEDCDGATDEAYAPVSTVCGDGVCAATGTTSCVAGSVEDSCSAGAPTGSDDTCDGLDDDCDGATDEAYASVATSCGDGVCAATGTTSCASGSVVDSCVAGSPTGSDDVCDGLDDDCDGATDEAYASVPTSCGDGVCAATGATSCVAGSVEDSCSAGAPTGSDDTCDGLDDDCDGTTDEAYASVATSCGDGVCAATGATSCVAGSVEDSCSAGAPTGSDDTCDGLDEDCDGVTDEAYAPVSTSCGDGVCAATGATSCVAGSVEDSCSAGAPTGSDDSCDGLDDDCDGVTDEAYVSVSTDCGEGVCAATGNTSCVSGSVVDSCTAGAPTGSDDVCDGADEDCDGNVDEAYAPVATSCGTGVCGATGATACVGGSVADSCAPGSPTGSDNVCDGADEDCDGNVDEAYASVATSCGTGQCVAAGATSCVAGSVVDSCSPGTPATADVLCDGLDEDCDGGVDENYVSLPTSCGVGACGAAGATLCMSGSVVDSCVPGMPAADDSTCDASDDDCDGLSDEDWTDTASSCGLGVCAATGSVTCDAGVPTDSCAPGTPTGADDCSGTPGADDDCDGTVDEDCCIPTTCFELQFTCGVVSDGCGGTLNCGTCLAPETCGGDGNANTCGIPTLPPDPTTIVPPEVGPVTDGLLGSLGFLFDGPNPVQGGVQAGAFGERQAGALSGCVAERDGSPLSGVRIWAPSHPDYGYTFTRTDGCYDFVVNGGGRTTLEYRQDNYLTVQRAVTPQWGEYTVLDDVVMIPRSRTSTVVELGATEGQGAVGDTETDSDGARTPVAFFPAGITAVGTVDGTTVPLSTGTLRMTEYTVGDTGPAAMPGTLPRSTMYTYAMDISFDEVGPNGSVEFDRDLYVYLDNFLDFPTGALIPNGRYDRDRQEWIPVIDGRVIEIVSVTNDLADLNVDGDVDIEDPADLALALGVTDDERRYLAQRYGAGVRVWRMPIRHFSDVDFNPSGRETGPPDTQPRSAVDPAQPEGQTTCPGSTIYCQAQGLGEDVPIAGTPHTLHYQSDRVLGNSERSRTITVNFEDLNPPAEAIGYQVRVNVLGRTIEDVVLPTTTQIHRVTWDGRDRFGRVWGRPVPVTYFVDFVVPETYFLQVANDIRGPTLGGTGQSLNAATSSWGSATCVPGADPCCVGPGASIIVQPNVPEGFPQTSQVTRPGRRNINGTTQSLLVRSYETVLGQQVAESMGLGGFDLAAHHRLDPEREVLLLGDGSVRNLDSVESIVRTVTGQNSISVYTPPDTDGDTALAANIHRPHELATGPDGSIYFVIERASSHEIWRVTPGGRVVPVLVDATRTPDAMAALQSAATHPGSSGLNSFNVDYMDIDGDGNLYLVLQHPWQHIVMLRRSGSLSDPRFAEAELITGYSQTNLPPDFWGDGVEAGTRRTDLRGLAVTEDGLIYFHDWSGLLVEITPARRFRVRYIPAEGGAVHGIAAGRNDAIFMREQIGNRMQIREVALDGTTRVVAGGGALTPTDDMIATDAELTDGAGLTHIRNRRIAATPDGTIYFTTGDVSCTNEVLWRMRDGVISRVLLGLGTNERRFVPHGCLGSADRPEGYPSSIAAYRNGVVVAERLLNRVLAVAGTSSVAGSDYQVPAADGSVVYHFDITGRHVATVDALTEAVLLAFEHNSAGQLVAVTDVDGRRTTFDRSLPGQVVIASPDGPGGEHVATTLALQPSGYADTVVDPEGATWAFDFDAGGLLERMWDPRGNVAGARTGVPYEFSYARFASDAQDLLGPWRLTADVDPLGGTQNLTTPVSGTTHTFDYQEVWGTYCAGPYLAGWRPVNIRSEVTRTQHGTSTRTVTTQANERAPVVSQVTHPTGRVTENRETDSNGYSLQIIPGAALDVWESADPLLGLEAAYPSRTRRFVLDAYGRGDLWTNVVTTREVSTDPTDHEFPPNVLTATTTTTVTATHDGSGPSRTTVSSYDAATRTFTVTTPEGRQSQRVIDADGRTIEVRLPGQVPTFFDYDADGYLRAVRRGSGASERRADYTYDARGFIDSVATRYSATQSRLVQFQNIDDRGQPRDTTVAGIGTTSTTPDVVGAPTSVSPPGQPAHGFDYDLLGRASEYRPPGVLPVADPSACPVGASCATYDLARRLDAVTLPDSQVLDLTWDTTTGLLASVYVPDDGLYLTGHTSDGRLDHVIAPNGGRVDLRWQADLAVGQSWSGTHSAVDPVTGDPVWSGPVVGSVDVAFSGFNEVETVSVAGTSGGHSVRFSYDGDGLVVATEEDGNPSGPASMSMVRSTFDSHLESSSIGVVSTTYAVDTDALTPGFGDFQGQTVTAGASTVYESTYTHDSAGRIVGWDETVEGVTTERRLEYDDGGRLTHVRDGLGVLVSEYQFDANGNRVYANVRGDVQTAGTEIGCPGAVGPLAEAANDRDQLCRYGGHEYVYDISGRLQTKTHISSGVVTAYHYDAGGRLRRVALPSGTAVDYVYDGMGRRVARLVNGVFDRGWLYRDALNPVAQIDASGAVVATYVYATHANIPDYLVTDDGRVLRLIADHLGSARLLIDSASGAVVERYDYDEWGNVVFESGDHSLHPFGFAGGLYDSATGLVRFGVRDYDASTGRWTTPEPLGFAADTNWYRYASGDPINFIDVNGRIGFLAAVAIAAVVGFAIGYYAADVEQEAAGSSATEADRIADGTMGAISTSAGVATGFAATAVGAEGAGALAIGLGGAGLAAFPASYVGGRVHAAVEDYEPHACEPMRVSEGLSSYREGKDVPVQVTWTEPPWSRMVAH